MINFYQQEIGHLVQAYPYLSYNYVKFIIYSVLDLSQKKIMKKVYLFIVFSFLYIPILTLITLSFNKSGLPTSWSGFSINWYYELFENQKIFKALLNTIIVAFFSTIIAGLLGTLLAMGMELRKSNKYIEAAAFIPMIIPDIVMAISLLSFYFVAIYIGTSFYNY